MHDRGMQIKMHMPLFSHLSPSQPLFESSRNASLVEKRCVTNVCIVWHEIFAGVLKWRNGDFCILWEIIFAIWRNWFLHFSEENCSHLYAMTDHFRYQTQFCFEIVILTISSITVNFYWKMFPGNDFLRELFFADHEKKTRKNLPHVMSLYISYSVSLDWFVSGRASCKPYNLSSLYRICLG